MMSLSRLCHGADRHELPYCPNTPFCPLIKTLHDNIIAEVDQAITLVADNPDIGERKKGDLAILRVYKFHSQGQLFLLGYTSDDAVQLVSLEAIVSHENFYRDLKR